MRFLLWSLLALSLHAQVIVEMRLMPSKGTAPQLGRGIAAYTWDLSACSAGPNPVPFSLVRIEFPEVRLYSSRQQASILATRIERSVPARTLRLLGYVSGGVGIGVTAAEKINKSPSWLGVTISISGLAIPAIQTMVSKDLPNFSIPNPAPDVIALQAGQCAEYTALAAYGKASEIVGPRRVNPIVK